LSRTTAWRGWSVTAVTVASDIPHVAGSTPESGTAPPPLGVSLRIGAGSLYVTVESPGLTTTRPFAK
jgi:hypothetical protein